MEKNTPKTKENQLVYTSEAEFTGLNPLLEETNLDVLLFRGLMRFDEKNESVADINEVDSVTKIVDHKLELKLKRRFTPMLDKLTDPILQKHVFEGVDMRAAKYNSHPIGAGPYMLTNRIVATVGR